MKFHFAVFAAASSVAFSLSFSITHAQVMLGIPIVIDGDTLRFGGETVRLYGIDAPESQQTCKRGAESWPCGQEAASALRRYVEGGRLDCQPRDFDVYGRIVAVCHVNGRDLSQSLAEGGYAIALTERTTAYAASEQAAQSARRGIWAGEFERPADYRAANPIKPQPASPRYSGRAVVPPRTVNPKPSTYYASCRQAWAAGAAPVYRGQPGYRVGLDGDLDGVACEPIRK
ncbi:thermonuclease family protein (plasmid) [Sphingobium sp. V4]|uniref:thermonuclease family protein n=1 Tax=Sphingobium sp. V4 TaxID=3038927 RepID=UPI002557F637|nr:thermonuclease family protein [Sphingobium sp. V4]WIW90251.1 thermonuclease family protein [Sphingobium sp. V4]